MARSDGSALRVGLIAVVLTAVVAVTPAAAQFTVPDNCMRGAGDYEGGLAGNGGFKIITESGPMKLLLCFSGAMWDVWAGDDPPLAPGTTEAVFLEALIKQSGGFTSSSSTYPGTGYTFSAEGLINSQGGCGITGTWQLRSPTGALTTGTFDFPANDGANCFDVAVASPACGAACGPMGIGTMVMTACGLAFMRSRVVQRRRQAARYVNQPRACHFCAPCVSQYRAIIRRAELARAARNRFDAAFQSILRDAGGTIGGIDLPAGCRCYPSPHMDGKGIRMNQGLMGMFNPMHSGMHDPNTTNPMHMGNYAQGGAPYQKYREMSVEDMLLENRIIFLAGPINERSASLVIMRLLYLQSIKKEQPINLYINCPGGMVDQTLAIYDTMQHLTCDIATYSIGQAASGGAVILAAGTKGKRMALPNSKIMLHQPWGGITGQAEDIRIQAEEILRDKQTLNEILAKHTGRPIKQIEEETERDRFLNPKQAVEWGIVDEIVEPHAKEKK